MNKFTKAIAAVMLMMAVIFAAGCTKPDEPNNGGNNNGQNDSVVDPNNGGNNGGGNGDIPDVHEYVDLGLPSGTLWATRNVGANAPEEYGDYFAWGETLPKTTYDWSTYKYYGGYNQLTKYCDYSAYGYNGFTDNLTTLQPSDDAATANWGSGWRMPSYEEWVELKENTTSTWMTRNGVNGRLFTASNGASLFLPAAGYRLNDELWQAVTSGCYWSSSLFPDDCPIEAYDFTIFSDGAGDSDRFCPREDGLSVRAVRSARQN